MRLLFQFNPVDPANPVKKPFGDGPTIAAIVMSGLE
jgi:hypothetical protein